MATADQLRAALEADNRGLVDSNLTVKTKSFDESLVHHIARKSYGLDCLKLLVDKFGASCLTQFRNQKGNAPLHLVAFFQDERSMDFIHSLLGEECFRVKGRFNRTIAFMAAENRRSNSVLKWIVRKKGAGFLSVTDSMGDSPVHMAARKQGEDSMQFFKSLFGTDCFLQRGNQGRTAIHHAAQNEGNSSVLKWLVGECGSDCLMEKDNRGDTAVHLAALNHGEDSLRLIKEQLGSLVFMLKDNSGETSVHKAAKNEKNSSALAWCVKDLGPNCLLAKDASGTMPIHLAAQHQDEKSVQLAVTSLGPDCLALAGEKRRTAVHFAATNSSSNSALRWIVSLLGPDCLTLRDADGSMALHLAAQHQGMDSLRLIKDSLGVAAFKLEGRDRQMVAHYAAESGRKQELIAWIVSEVGPRSLLVPDALGRTPADLAGYYE